MQVRVMKGNRKQSWIALSQNSKSKTPEFPRSATIRIGRAVTPGQRPQPQAQMMDPRKGGTPTVRGPDGGTIGGGKKYENNTPVLLSANQMAATQD